jgi:GNAT superfamily N-acetyltransferase
VHPHFKEIEDEMFAWGEERVRAQGSRHGKRPQITIECDPGDWQREETLVQRGYTRDSNPSIHFTRSLEAALPDPVLSPGYSVRGLVDEGNLEKWMDLAWSAFPHWRPRYSLAHRRVLQHAPTYRKDLDLVLVGPDEEFISFCPVWWYEVNRWAAFEPIGTRAEYQRQGFMKALLRAAMWKVRRLGGTRVDMGGPERVARSAGFDVQELGSWTKPL